MQHYVKINPGILAWARESAGLEVEEAAQKLALGASHREKLLELEQGTRLPTRTQLNKFAKTYRRPLITFYMSEPPKKAPHGEDFRSTGAEISLRENALLDALLRDIRARQEMVRDILEDIDEASPKSFVSSSAITDNAKEVAQRITNALQIPMQRSDWGNSADEFFRQLRAATEKLGVFVLLVGDLGSHHSTLDENVFRGYASVDTVAPFIVINDHDARTARSFTLIHELAHIYVGKSGISGTPESITTNSTEGQVEQFCNDVAGFVLLPRSFATQKPQELSRDNQNDATRYIEEVAKHWIVSEPLVAFRLYRLGWISQALYRDLSRTYADRWEKYKSTNKSTKIKKGGPDYYVLRQNKLGNALVGVVCRTVRENLLTHTRAARVLGIKPSSVEPLLRRYEKSPDSLTRGVIG